MMWKNILSHQLWMTTAKVYLCTILLEPGSVPNAAVNITRYSACEDMKIDLHISLKKQIVSRHAHPHHHMQRIVFSFFIKVHSLLSLEEDVLIL